jgi:hypothetical protein
MQYAWRDEKCVNVLVGEPERKRLLRRGHRRECGFKMDLKEIGWKDVDWINLAQNRDRYRGLVDKVTVMNLHIP